MFAKKICNILIELGIISLLIFPPIVFGAVQPQYITYIYLIILFIALVWIIKVFIRGSRTYIVTPLDLPILFFFIWCIVNLFTSCYFHNTERTIFLLLNYALLYFLVVQHLKTARRILGLAFIIVLVGSGECVFGLLQYLGGAKTVLGVPISNIGTLNATYINHNHFAGFLTLIIPIALGLLIGTGNIEKKIFLFILIGLMGTSLVLTLSRGGLFSFFVALGVLLVCLFLKNRRSSEKTAPLSKYALLLLLLVVVVVAYIGWIGISPIAHRSLFETFFPTKDTLQQEIRIPLWRNALALVKESPILGSGLGTFEYGFLRYRPDEIPQDKQVYRAHNDYLELLIETGFPGLLIIIWAIVRFFRSVLNTYSRGSDPFLTNIALGGLSGATAILIQSFFDFNLQIPANALLFAMILAMTIATVQLMSQGHNKNHEAQKEKRATQRLKTYDLKLSWRFIITGIIVIIILACNFRHNIAMWYCRKANQAHYRGQWFWAISLYQKALTIDSKNPLFYERLGVVYADLGKRAPHSEKWYGLAIQAYRNAIAQNEYNPLSYYYLGWTYDTAGMEEEAIRAFQQAITRNPRISFYYENLGRYYLIIGQVEPAMEAYKHAVQLNPPKMGEILGVCQQFHLPPETFQQFIPEDPENRMRFASLLEQQKLWGQSKIEYRKALELSGGQAKYYEAMLNACHRKRDYQCMRTLWQELWAQNPDNLALPINIAESFAQQQLWDQAIAHYKALLADHSENLQLQQRLAQLYQKRGLNEEALQAFQAILKLQPDNINIYHNIASIYREKEQLKAALDVYQKAIARGLKQTDIYTSLGNLYQQIGAEQEALKAYEQAVQAGEPRMAVYVWLEQRYQAQKNEIAVELLWNTYVLVNKNNPEAVFQLVKHYYETGEWLKAVNLSKELIANAPNDEKYRKFLANLYEQKGMVYETIEQWQKLVNMNTGNIEYHLHLAALYEQVKQWDDAKTQYRKVLRIQPGHPIAQQKLASLGG